MFALEDGDILPGVGIGRLRLGDDESSIRDILPELSAEKRRACTVYTGENVMIRIEDDSKKISHIRVFDKFEGKLMARFGIGTFFSEMEAFLGEKVILTYEIMFEYNFPSIPGACFELQDLDLPDELLNEKDYEELAPIGAISVYVEDDETEQSVL